MRGTKTVTGSITTDSGGDGTVLFEATHGRLIEVRYTKDDFADGSTMTLTNNTSSETIWTEADVDASAVRRPRIGLHKDSDGTALLYAAAGEPVTEQAVFHAGEQAKMTIASGGDTKSGTYELVFEVY